MSLCEENYHLLLRMIPELRRVQGELRASRMGGPDLHLEIIEQSRYTTLLRLTYLFPYADGKVHRVGEADPDALLRVYHDAGQVEVIDLLETALPLRRGTIALRPSRPSGKSIFSFRSGSPIAPARDTSSIGNRPRPLRGRRKTPFPRSLEKVHLTAAFVAGC